jgi:hypothetical protein
VKRVGKGQGEAGHKVWSHSGLILVVRHHTPVARSGASLGAL